VYQRVTQLPVPDRVAIVKLLQQDCQGLANTNKAVQLLKRLYEKQGWKLPGELEARFEPIKPGQGPFSRPPPPAAASVDPDTVSSSDSQQSGQEGASQQPPKSDSGKSRSRSSSHDRGSTKHRDRSSSSDRSGSRDRGAKKPATAPSKGTFAQVVKQKALAPGQKIVIAAPRVKPAATMTTCPPPQRPLKEDVKGYGPDFSTTRVAGSTGKQQHVSQDYRTKEVMRHRIEVCQSNLNMPCSDLPPVHLHEEGQMEVDAPRPVPVAMGVGPGKPAAVSRPVATARSADRPTVSAGTPSSDGVQEISVPAPQGHGFSGPPPGAPGDNYAWFMGRRVPMVSPGLRIQGMIEVPGPALISITSLTEGVAEGLPRVQVPTTFTIHTDRAFWVSGRVTALPAFPRHSREFEDLLRNMEGLHIMTPGEESAGGSPPPSPPPPPPPGFSGGQGPSSGGPKPAADAHPSAPIPDLMGATAAPNGSQLPAALEAQAYSPIGLVMGTPTPLLVELVMSCENQTSAVEEVMEEEVVEVSDSDSTASGDSQLARYTQQVVGSPPVPDGVTKEQWQETLSTVESDVSEARSSLDSRASTSRDVNEDSAEEEGDDGLDPESREVMNSCGDPVSDDESYVEQSSAELLAQADELTGDGVAAVETVQTESEPAPDCVVGTLMVRVAQTTLGDDSDDEEGQSSQLSPVEPVAPSPVAAKVAADADPVAGQGDASSAEDL
jgi:hypothetical protein